MFDSEAIDFRVASEFVVLINGKWSFARPSVQRPRLSATVVSGKAGAAQAGNMATIPGAHTDKGISEERPAMRQLPSHR